MRTKKMVYCALFAAVTGIMSQIAIPTQPIAFNMAIFAVLLTGGMLGKRYGTLSIVVYILIGAVGVPVFTGFRGGFTVLTGPTGGYIIGYIMIAFITGAVFEKTKKIKYTVPFMLISVLLCYAVGTAWYCCVMESDVQTATMLCVLPFIPWDLVKVIMAAIVLKKTRCSKMCTPHKVL